MIAIFMCLGDAISREEERGKAEKRVLPDPVEEARRQAHHPSQADTRLLGRQQGTQQGEETQDR